jgi:hypothetical protein
MMNHFYTALLSIIFFLSACSHSTSQAVTPYNHDPGFTWLSGQLKFDPGIGWYVEYQKNPPLTEYGTDDALGRVRLYLKGTPFDSVHFELPTGIKEGDLVLVEGVLTRVTEAKNGSKTGRTMYEVKKIQLLSK